MLTEKARKERDEKIIKWLTEGIRNGSLKTELSYGDDGQITSVTIGLTTPKEAHPIRGIDPRRTKPL